VRGDRGGIHGRKFPAEAQQRIGPQRNDRAKQHRGERGQPDFREPGFRDGDAAFEPDRDQQIDRQADVERLGEFQVAFRQCRDEAEDKDEDRGREEVGLDGGDDVHEFAGSRARRQVA